LEFGLPQNDFIEFYNPSPSKVVLPGSCNLYMYKEGIVYDVIGQIGFAANANGWGVAPVNTTNHTLRRTCGIPVVRKTDPYAAMDDAAFSAQFDSFAADTVDDAAHYSCP
jgi:hypothetical protein